MTRPAILVSLALLLASPATLAQELPPDCGDPPMNTPDLPDGETVGRDNMLAAVEAVREYSGAVDDYLSCMDRRFQVVGPWMNEDQQTRWQEDLDTVHRNRIELQQAMNAEIRENNARTDPEAGS